MRAGGAGLYTLFIVTLIILYALSALRTEGFQLGATAAETVNKHPSPQIIGIIVAAGLAAVVIPFLLVGLRHQLRRGRSLSL